MIYDFQILENNLLLLKNQFIIYQKMMNKLNIKDNSDLFQQNQEKIDFIEELYSIINHNTSIIESYIDKNEYNLSAKRIYMSELNFENRYSKDIIEYFKDYGGICLFQLQAYKRNFFSRIFSF